LGALIAGISLTVLVWIIATRSEGGTMSGPPRCARRSGRVPQSRFLAFRHHRFLAQRLTSTAVAMALLIVPVIVVIMMHSGAITPAPRKSSLDPDRDHPGPLHHRQHLRTCGSPCRS
jgi:hypothetical protein